MAAHCATPRPQAAEGLGEGGRGAFMFFGGWGGASSPWPLERFAKWYVARIDTQHPHTILQIALEQEGRDGREE